jgi:hypothetical protein
MGLTGFFFDSVEGTDMMLAIAVINVSTCGNQQPDR